MTIKELIECQKTFKQAYDETGLISITSRYVLLTNEYFMQLFGALGYRTEPMEHKNDEWERKIEIEGVTFTCLCYEHELFEEEKIALGLMQEDDDF